MLSSTLFLLFFHSIEGYGAGFGRAGQEDESREPDLTRSNPKGVVRRKIYGWKRGEPQPWSVVDHSDSCVRSLHLLLHTCMLIIIVDNNMMMHE